MGISRRLLAALLGVVVILPTTPSPAVQSTPGLLGGSPNAPRQESGSADGIGPAPDTRTKLSSPQRSTAPPAGAVGDRIAPPPVGGHEPVKPMVLKDVPVRVGEVGAQAQATTINADPDDTYVTSGAPGTHSGETQLKAGKEGASGISASYLHFAELRNRLRDQYIVGASLVLFNAGSASCTAKPVDVYAVGGPWSGGTLTKWPGAPLAQHLAQKSFAHGGGATCSGGNYEAFALSADLVTDWTHGAPFHGLSVRATVESDSQAFKRFGSANVGSPAVPYLDIKYSPHGASYYVNEVMLPTAGPKGRLKATVTNRGSTVWPQNGPHKFGFIIKQGQTTVRTSPKFDIPRAVGPNASVALDVEIDSVDPGDYQVLMTMYDGASDYHTAYGVPYGAFDMTVVNIPPSVNYEQPGSGASVDSLTPTLFARAHDPDNWPNKGFRYDFKLCDGPPNAPANCLESGWTNATWTPPPGRLRWSQTYYWWVRAHDTVKDGPYAGPLAITTRVPQPEITAHIGGTPQGAAVPGLSMQVGNFGTQTTDAAVATVGPDLTVTRTYNSLDPRPNTAFGQGWASRLDTQLEHDLDGSGNEVVTLPSGRQVRFGRNTDGSYAPPQGQNLTLVLNTATGYYTLRDSTGGSWEFNPHGRLRTITDPSGLTEELEYDVAGPVDKPRNIYNHTSERRLYLTWTGAHVTSVRTDPPTTDAPALEWKYAYDGDKLLSACDPGPTPNCTRYDYQTGSHYRTVVLDDGPRAYYRFSEVNGTEPATSATARKPGADSGKYSGVALGESGPLPRPPNPQDRPDRLAEFNGQSSRVDLPPSLINQNMNLAVELWFRTTAGGVLISYENTERTLYTPVLYVGQDGLLRGSFWVPQPNGQRQISSQEPVNDGQWHHAVLSASINRQTLYLDGVAQPGTIEGLIDHDEMPNMVVGTGKTVHWASGNNGDYFFAGGIDEVALYHHPLGATAVAQHFAARQEVVQLTKITTPQNDRVAAALTYDYLNDRVATYTDRDGREWRLDTPHRDEAVRKVTLRGPYPDWVYEYDADNGGRPTARTHDGRTRKFGYNEKGFQSEEIDENSHKATFTTDARGNVLSRKTCRKPDSCQTAYSTYFLNAGNPLDPRNDRKLSDSDARSAGPDDVTYRTTYEYDAVGRMKTVSYPKPNGVTTNPIETWRYSTGGEDADGGGKTPAGLLIEHTGKRPGQLTVHKYRSTGDLAETVDPAGLRKRYEYDGIGRKKSLESLSKAGTSFGRTEFAYTARSQIDTVTGPVVRNTVSNMDHRPLVKYGYDANGNTMQITLSDTTGTDPPRTTKYEYNQHDQLIVTIMPDGRRETREYRNAGQETLVTDPRGTTWIDYTDSQSRLLRRIASGPGVDPENPSATVLTLETRSYDPAGRLAAVRDAMGRESTFTYYDDDLPATTTRAGVVTEQREYDPAGNVTKLTTAGGRVVTSTFDPAGYAATVALDPTGLNRKTSYTRDADGLVRTESRTGAADTGRTESTAYGYNTAGHLLREEVQLAPGEILSTTYVRDERGLVKQHADRRRMTTDFDYDLSGRLIRAAKPEVETWVGGQRSVTRPTITYGHNTFGEPTHQRDPNGAVTVMSYDDSGRTSSVQRPEYTPPGGQPLRPVERTEYDRLGNPIKSIDPLNRLTERTFDPYGRILTETLPKVGDQPSTTTYSYDRNGELLSTTDPRGASQLSTYDSRGRKKTDTAVERNPQLTYFTTTYGYDDADNLTSVKSPAEAITKAEYNAAGEKTVVTDPANLTTKYGYDIVGRQESITDPAGAVTRIGYDLLGRATTKTQIAGSPAAIVRSTTRTYDPNGNLATIASPEGRLRTFTYDADNRLVRQEERVDAAKTIRTTFGYDAAGNRTRFVDGNGHATDYTFNPWGNEESTVEHGGATWTSFYDITGERTRSTAPGGVTLTFEYDEQRRLKLQRGTGAEAPTADKTYGYGPSGLLTSFGGPGGDTALTYDDRGNLLTTRGPSGDATFTYTAESLVATRTDASGAASFFYDPARRPSYTVDALSGRTIDYTYDSAGRLAYSAERGMDRYVKRVNEYDVIGRLKADNVKEFDPNGGQPRIIHGTEYGYDRDDNITTKTTITNGQQTLTSYGYDGASRLTSVDATPIGWDDAGNRTKVGSTTFSYDERNQLKSDSTTQYTYTPRGTLASAGARAPKFDAFDQLVQDGVTYAYDSLGRVAKRGDKMFAYGGVDNDVVSDGVRLVSRDPDGEPLSDNVIGSTLPGKLLYADRHGDITGRYRGLSSFAQRAFDPFGNVTSSSGEQSSLGYQGEWTEPTTGAVNMHSRWYTPGTGTFISRDTWAIPSDPSAAANRYTYANANPLAYTDPNGHGWISDLFCRILRLPCGGGGNRGEYGNNGDDAETPKPPKWQQPPSGEIKGNIPGGPHPGNPNSPPGGSGTNIRQPPPLWQRNLNTPPQRPAPGTTAPVRPPTIQLDEHTRINVVDMSQLYAQENTKITVGTNAHEVQQADFSILEKCVPVTGKYFSCPPPSGIYFHEQTGKDIVGNGDQMSPSERWHQSLGLLGMVPHPLGVAADLTDSGLYFSEGDWRNGITSLGYSVPVVGDLARAFGKGADLLRSVQRKPTASLPPATNGRNVERKPGSHSESGGKDVDVPGMYQDLQDYRDSNEFLWENGKPINPHRPPGSPGGSGIA